MNILTLIKNMKCSICKQPGHNKRSCSSPLSSYRINRLKECLLVTKTDHDVQIMKEPTLKDAHIYCVINCISAQQYGPLLEKFIWTKFKYSKNKAKDCTGDCSKDGNNIEIKVSLGGSTHEKFNFVQIRPDHDCDWLLTAYHLSLDNVEQEGELFIFKVSKAQIKQLIVSHGGYAHGTIKQNGKIAHETFNENALYALRPTVNDECWNALMAFRILETTM